MTHNPRRRAVARTAALAVAASSGLMAWTGLTQAAPAAEPAAEPDRQILNADSPSAVDGEYIVVFKNQGQTVAASRRTAHGLAEEHGGRILHTYGRVVDGYAVKMTDAQAQRVAADSSVKYVQQSNRYVALDTQSNPPNWGDDRLDQNDLPLDQSYEYPSNAGQGVHVYVMDTGVNLSHQEFTGRTAAGFDAVDNDTTPTDCQGHGTHVAGTAVGTTYGVAKRATLHAVRVLNCQGSGTDADILAGVEWVKANAIKPAVVNYSIGCQSRCTDVTMDNAVKSLVASGVVWVQAAGNSNDDACYYSPQNVPEGITVSNMTISDAKASTSSYGPCTDLWAPGTNIISASYTSNTGTATMSGTSMASPHTAGAAALYLGANPTATPAQVQTALVNNTIANTLTGVGSTSPNKLLNIDFLNGGTPPPPPPPGDCTPQTNATNVTVSDNATVESSVAIGGCTGNASSSATVAVDIKHTYIGDLKVDLVAPDGSVYTLHNRSGGSADNINTTYTVNLSGEVANGTWKLRVNDNASQDTGYIDSWTLNTGTSGGGGTCAPASNGTNVNITDFTTVESSVTISGCSGNASSTSKVQVTIVHTYIGDLKVDLVAPDGSVYTLHNRSGGSADNINTTYTVNLSGEARNGTWKLRVNDAAAGDTGYIDTWTLTS